MPTIKFDNHSIQCEAGDNVRRVLMNAGLPLYNGAAKFIHCRGLGTCGTCAVEIKGETSPMTGVEAWRLNFPPHRGQGNKEKLRLACQCCVQGDLEITKHDGMWGQLTTEESNDA